jgi:A/G-specific adenine glycosylase
VLSTEHIQAFQQNIYDYYHAHRRDFVWRRTVDPYHIVVSEIMLQQTQTFRVEPKFGPFVEKFPTFAALAEGSVRDLLLVWQGLGYSRRALALQKTAQRVVTEFNSQLPNDPLILETFPGIGKATAASVCAFAFNNPTIFIETNIRAVFIHFFFTHQHEVTDKQLWPFVAAVVDYHNPREWYYALMDYGVMLKKLHKNPSRRSAHHATQSRFEGSDRQIRGMILRALTVASALTFEQLCFAIEREPERIQKMVQQLCAEQFLKSVNNQFMLA